MILCRCIVVKKSVYQNVPVDRVKYITGVYIYLLIIFTQTSSFTVAIASAQGSVTLSLANILSGQCKISRRVQFIKIRVT